MLSSSISISVTFPVLFHLISLTSAQLPATAPACVQNCARLKVSEGYCTSSQLLTSAFTQCLRDNCNPADAATGNQYTNQICGPTNTTEAPPPPPAAINTTATNTTATNATTAANLTGYSATLNNALQTAGLTSFATLLASPTSQGLVNVLENGNHLVFAPTNDALSALTANSTSQNNTADLEALLKYHVLPGTLNASALPATGHAIVRSSLAGQPYVELPANDAQVIVLAGNQSLPITIIEPTRNITVSNTTSVGNLQVAVIPTALTIPGTIATTAATIPELSSFVGAVNAASPQLLEQLGRTPGLTVFAPINQALNGGGNMSNFQGILLNHLVNGTVLYSTVLANVTNTTSAGGALLTFAVNGNQATVSANGKTLKIVQADILTRNGVIHLVDGVFDASNVTPTFPLPNTNNATETVGITPVGNGGSSARQGAQSGGIAFQPSQLAVVSSLALLSLALYF